MSHKKCVEPGCGNSVAYGSDNCKTHGGGKRCVEPGCGKGAAGKTDKCVSHGGGRRCVELGCGKSAAGRTDKCKAHGGGKRCVEPMCDKSAQGGTDKCAAHGGGTRCVELGCGNSASYGSDKCITHGGGKRCIELGCGNSAVGGYDKCIAHGGGKRCVELGCDKSARGRTDKCAAHGGGRRCVELGCGKGAAGGTDKCFAHGGGARCPNCIDWIDSRGGSPEYDGYCATCFKRLFPNDPRSKKRYNHTKELMVRNHINEHFHGFIHDTPLYTGNCDCSHRRRIDHRKLIGNTILAIETDEFGHRGYDAKDEDIRYDDVYMIHSGKWIFIRFNPDTNVSKIDVSDKLDKLIETMNECITRIEQEENRELVEIIKLYC